MLRNKKYRKELCILFEEKRKDNDLLVVPRLYTIEAKQTTMRFSETLLIFVYVHLLVTPSEIFI